jgi:hypothetical protein
MRCEWNESTWGRKKIVTKNLNWDLKRWRKTGPLIDKKKKTVKGFVHVLVLYEQLFINRKKWLINLDASR